MRVGDLATWVAWHVRGEWGRPHLFSAAQGATRVRRRCACATRVANACLTGIKGLLPARTYSNFISQAAFAQLHAPFKAPDASNNGDYAMGWTNSTGPDQMQQDGSYAGFRTNMIGACCRRGGAGLGRVLPRCCSDTRVAHGGESDADAVFAGSSSSSLRPRTSLDRLSFGRHHVSPASREMSQGCGETATL